MLDRNCGLRSRQGGRVGRLLKADQVAPRLIGAEPVPGLSGGNIVLTDVEQLLAFPNLALRAVEDDSDPVLAVEKLNIVKDIALRTIRFGKAEQLTVAIDLRLPTGRKVAFDARPVEGCPRCQRAIGHDRTAPGGGRARNPAVE